MKKEAVKTVVFYSLFILGNRKKDAERTNRAKTRHLACFWLPEGVQWYVERRGWFVA